jgi:hypothetical protein
MTMILLTRRRRMWIVRHVEPTTENTLDKRNVHTPKIRVGREYRDK